MDPVRKMINVAHENKQIEYQPFSLLHYMINLFIIQLGTNIVREYMFLKMYMK